MQPHGKASKVSLASSRVMKAVPLQEIHPLLTTYVRNSSHPDCPLCKVSFNLVLALDTAFESYDILVLFESLTDT